MKVSEIQIDNARALSETPEGRQHVMSLLGLAPKGGRYWCPLCQTNGQHKDPDFSIDAGFVCQKGCFKGDGLRLVQKIKGLDFLAAVEFLTGEELPKVKVPHQKKKSDKIYPTLEKAVSAMEYGFKQGGYTLANQYEYRKATGEKAFIVLRFEKENGKAFCQLQKVPDGWTKGLPEHRTLYNLHQLATRPDETVYVVEGEKNADALTLGGLLTVTSTNGSKAGHKSDWTPLSGRRVVMLPDNDESGKAYAKQIKKAVSHAVILRLDGLPENGGDVVNWLEAGRSIGELKELASDLLNKGGEGHSTEAEKKEPPEASSCSVLLPSNETPIIEAAKGIYKRMAKTERFFLRGNVVHEIDGKILAPIKPPAFRTRIESLGNCVKYISVSKELALVNRRPTKEDCLAILEALERRELPEIEIVLQSPMIFNAGESVVTAESGYCEQAKAYVFGRNVLPSVDAKEAAEALLNLLRDYDFVSDGDRARALTGLFVPALRMGGFITDGRCPMYVAEANAEQAGKGTYFEMTAAIYGESPDCFSIKNGGVGSFDESLQQRLIDGRPFIQLDNLRGKVDSKYLEMVLTAPGPIGCRVPRVPEIKVDPRRFMFTATSNGIEATSDLAARCCIFRIKKRQDGYAYHNWPEGDLIAHVKANSLFYLACVHSIIKSWFNAGAVLADVTGHSFKLWHKQTQGIINHTWPESGAVIDEQHKRTTQRMANPDESFIRQLCQCIAGGTELTASEIAELALSNDMKIPRTKPEADEKTVARMIGRIMGKMFAGETETTIDDYTITKIEYEYQRSDGNGYNTGKKYCFSTTSIHQPLQSTTIHTTSIENLVNHKSNYLLKGIEVEEVKSEHAEQKNLCFATDENPISETPQPLSADLEEVLS